MHPHSDPHTEGQNPRSTVAILLPDSFDEWLTGLGVPLEAFCQQMMGSWMFNYAQALRSAGVQIVLFCITMQVSAAQRRVHGPTGAVIHFLPPTRLYSMFRRHRPGDAIGTKPMAVATGLMTRLWRSLRRLVATHVDTPLSVLFRALQHEGCHTLLVQEYESARFDLCVLFGKLKRIQVFGTFQGGQPHNWLSRPLRRLAMWLSTGLLIPATSEAHRVMTRYRIPVKRINATFSPFDSAIFHPSSQQEARQSVGIPTNAKVVMYHGAITLHYKGLDVLLEAWHQLLRITSGEDIRLVIIGTGDDADRFSERISAKQLKGIHWINQWIHDRHLIRRYLSAADVYVFPSRGDACPNAVIEAMACGLPVVASDVNGIPDLLDGEEGICGILIPPEDACAAAKALHRLLDDPTLAKELGRRAFRRARHTFAMEAVGMQLKSVLLKRAMSNAHGCSQASRTGGPSNSPVRQS